jgi:hypothetical protein
MHTPRGSSKVSDSGAQSHKKSNIHNSTVVINGGDFKPLATASQTRYSLDSTNPQYIRPSPTTAAPLSSSLKTQGTFRSLMHNLMNHFDTTEASTINKQYTKTLRSSISGLKGVAKAKLESVNMSPPKVW